MTSGRIIQHGVPHLEAHGVTNSTNFKLALLLLLLLLLLFISQLIKLSFFASIHKFQTAFNKIILRVLFFETADRWL